MKFFATILAAVALVAANVEAAGKCDNSTRTACPRNDVQCKFNRKIRGQWYCVHHEDSPECERVKDDIKISALLGTTADRVDRLGRCWM